MDGLKVEGIVKRIGLELQGSLYNVLTSTQLRQRLSFTDSKIIVPVFRTCYRYHTYLFHIYRPVVFPSGWHFAQLPDGMSSKLLQSETERNKRSMNTDFNGPCIRSKMPKCSSC